MPDSNITSGGSGGTGSASAGTFVQDGGEVLVGKLVSTLLGAVWLTVVGGWIAIVDAIVQVQLAMINAAARGYAGIIRALGQGGAETLRIGWASAFRAAIQTDPLFAPLLLTLEVMVVAGIALTVRRRLL